MLPVIAPMFKRLQFIYVSPTSACQILTGTCIRLYDYVVQPFGSYFFLCLLWLLLTFHSSLFLLLMMRPVKPHGAQVVRWTSTCAYYSRLHLTMQTLRFIYKFSDSYVYLDFHHKTRHVRHTQKENQSPDSLIIPLYKFHSDRRSQYTAFAFR